MKSLLAVKKIKFTFILILLCGLVVSGAHLALAQKKTPAPQLFYKANEYYEKAEYEKAKDSYLEILGSGLDSGNIYYNLGNAYFKLGQLGRAVVNYERARILIPQDSDVKANLAYALSLCHNPVIPSKQNSLIKIGRRLAADFTLDNWTGALSACYLILLVLAGMFIAYKTPVLKRAVVSAASILVLTGFVWGIKFHDQIIVKNAIVIKPESDCRFAPSAEAVVHFKAFEGAKIRVIDKNSSWFRVKTPDGKIGWVLQSDIELI